MAGLNATSKLSWIDLYSSDTTLIGGLELGMFQFGSNGKGFRYALAGGSALVVGNALQSSAVDTQFQGMVFTSLPAAKGVTAVSFVNGTTTIAANQFDGGSFQVTTSSTASANIGEEYTILGHTTGISGATITVYLDRPLRTAITAATTTCLIARSPWSGVVQGTGGSATGTPVGVAVFAIPNAAYGWIQTKGVASALSDSSTYAVGSLLGPSVAVAGAVGVFVAGTARSYIGFAMTAQNSAHAAPIQLTLD